MTPSGARICPGRRDVVDSGKYTPPARLYFFDMCLCVNHAGLSNREGGALLSTHEVERRTVSNTSPMVLALDSSGTNPACRRTKPFTSCVPLDVILERGYLRRKVFSHGVRHVLRLRNLVQHGVHLRPEQVGQFLNHRLSAYFPRRATSSEQQATSMVEAVRCFSEGHDDGAFFILLSASTHAGERGSVHPLSPGCVAIACRMLFTTDSSIWELVAFGVRLLPVSRRR